MAVLQESGPSPAEAAIPAAPNDRRRPGRIDNINPNLLPLLRNPAPPESADADLVGLPCDDLKPAKGIVAAILIALPFWILVALGGWWVFH